MDKNLLEIGNKFLKEYGNYKWDTDFVLRMGVAMAQEANKFSDLSGVEKGKLVVTTLLTILAAEEILEKGRKEGSTVREGAIAVEQQFEKCKMVVTTVLPLTIDLVISASRGKFDFQKIVSDVASVAASGKLDMSFLESLWKNFVNLCTSEKSVEAVVPAPVAVAFGDLPLSETNPLYSHPSSIPQETKSEKENDVQSPEEVSVSQVVVVESPELVEKDIVSS